MDSDEEITGTLHDDRLIGNRLWRLAGVDPHLSTSDSYFYNPRTNFHTDIDSNACSVSHRDT